ncbi:hypothetical protein QBC43DRAFT_290623 [Cladorrhinum sp. PSN259]|nr:hypothetical protein QBC43DRAFT_290623 [Cladorrhinum sp. PSN259]
MCKFLAYKYQKCGHVTEKQRQSWTCAKTAAEYDETPRPSMDDMMLNPCAPIYGTCEESECITTYTLVTGYCNKIQGPDACRVCIGMAKVAFQDKTRLGSAISEVLTRGNWPIAGKVIGNPRNASIYAAGMKYGKILSGSDSRNVLGIKDYERLSLGMKQGAGDPMWRGDVRWKELRELWPDNEDLRKALRKMWESDAKYEQMKRANAAKTAIIPKQEVVDYSNAVSSVALARYCTLWDEEPSTSIETT